MSQLCFHTFPGGPTFIQVHGPECTGVQCDVSLTIAEHATKKRKERITDDTEETHQRIQRDPEAYRP